MTSVSNTHPRQWLAIGSAAALALTFIASGPAFAANPDPDPEQVTFADDVAPILQENCQICHQPGAIGPMSLMTYDEVRPWAQVIKLRVANQEMPPYHYDTDVGIQDLKYDKRLSDEEIATIVNWVDAGLPTGDLASIPPTPEFPKAGVWQLADSYGRQPDLVVAADPYTVEAGGQDRWWQPTVPTGLTEDRCIRAIETKPSVEGRGVTHHANSSLRFPGTDEMQSARLSEYALGKLGEIIPEDACRIIPAGSEVSWDIHYFPGWAENDVPDDQVEVGLWFYGDEEDTSDLYRQTLSLYRLQGQGTDYAIAPHGTMMTQGFHSFDHPVRIDSFQPHGHLRMTGMKLEIFYPQTGRKEVVSQVSNWSPLWHLSHVYEDHAAPLIPAGAVLVLTGYYDNTADNPHNPDPNQWVGSGDRTSDEMSHAWIAVTHLDDEGFERLVAEREARNVAADRTAGDN
ncbi:MAG: cytochrome c [Gemmatimonadota bacterium]